MCQRCNCIFILAIAVSIVLQGSARAWAMEPTATEHWPGPGVQAAFDAVLAGDNAKLQELLDAGVDVNGRNVFNMTLLDVAVAGTNKAGPDLALVEILLKAGCDPNAASAGQTLLDQAVSADNVELLKLLLQYSANPAVEDKVSTTAVDTAAHFADPAVLRAFAEAGVDLKAERGISGQTLLHEAMEPWDYAGEPDPLGTVQFLLDYGFDPNVRDDYGRTPLYTMFSSIGQHFDEQLLGMAECLVKHGADVNARNSFGETPLMSMFSFKQLPLCLRLIELGADVNAPDSTGQTLLHRVADWAPPKVITELIAQGADPNIRDGDGLTPLHLAVLSQLESPPESQTEDSGLAEVVQILRAGIAWAVLPQLSRAIENWGGKYDAADAVQALLDGGAAQDLAVYAARGALDTVRKLVKLDGVLTSDPQIGQVALSLAARLRQADVAQYLIAQGVAPSLRACVELGDLDLLQARLAAGADPQALVSGYTALYVAAERGDCAAIQTLVEGGAEVNAPSLYGCTALVGAISGQQRDAVALLLSLGADPLGEVGAGRPSLSWASMTGDLAICQLLLDAGADVNARDGDGATPLHHAATGEHASGELVALLIAHGADVNALQPYYGTPVGAVCDYLSYGGMEESTGIAVLDRLLAAGADLEIPNGLGYTPLAWALTSYDPNLVEYLLLHGANPNALTSYGTTLLLEAIVNNEPVAALLRKYGATEPSLEIIAEAKKYQIFGEDSATATTD